jgi:Tripartite tricarboxylate transporter family receptor
VQLVRQFKRVKHLHGIGADVDAGAELRKLRRLLVDVHLEALAAKRNGRRQSPKPGPYDSNPTCARHVSSIEYIRAGKLCALAVTTSTRSDALPDLPTVGDFLPGFDASERLDRSRIMARRAGHIQGVVRHDRCSEVTSQFRPLNSPCQADALH